MDRADTANDYTYSVVVRATDPSGEFGEATLTIHVLDVEETPQLTGPAALTYFENQPAATTNTDTAANDNLILHRDPTSGVDATEDRVAYMAADNDLDDDTLATDDSQLREIQWELTGPDAGRFQFEDSASTYTNSDELTSDATTAIATRTPASATSPKLRFRERARRRGLRRMSAGRGETTYTKSRCAPG